jgi:hypothetical protein
MNAGTQCGASSSSLAITGFIWLFTLPGLLVTASCARLSSPR